MTKTFLHGCVPGMVAAGILGLLMQSENRADSTKEGFYFSKKAQELRKFLPKTEDPVLKELFAKHLIFYTENEVPRAYQHDSGLHNPYYNISAVAAEPHGNPNIEFPWGGPAGTHRSKIQKFGFIHLPKPIQYWDEQMYQMTQTQDGSHYRWARRWLYQDGTIVGEVILNKEGYVVDLRTRKKNDGKWRMNAYRPILDRKEYDEVVKSLGGDPGKPNVTIKTLKNRHPNKEVINTKAAIDNLGKLDYKIVKAMLERPVKSAMGIPWIVHEGHEGYAPTTDEEYQIVPKNYDAGFISVDSTSCMRCHDGVMKHADDFERVRDWYGRVRGDDGIFSFHPFEPSSISGNGFNIWPVHRKELIQAGLLKRWSK